MPWGERFVTPKRDDSPKEMVENIRAVVDGPNVVITAERSFRGDTHTVPMLAIVPRSKITVVDVDGSKITLHLVGGTFQLAHFDSSMSRDEIMALARSFLP